MVLVCMALLWRFMASWNLKVQFSRISSSDADGGFQLQPTAVMDPTKRFMVFMRF